MSKKREKKSLLTRLFDKKKPIKQPNSSPKALTPRERSFAEIKQLAEIGKKDPERLARLLSAMLRKNRSEEKDARTQLDKYVTEIVRRDEEQRGQT